MRGKRQKGDDGSRRQAGPADMGCGMQAAAMQIGAATATIAVTVTVTLTARGGLMCAG